MISPARWSFVAVLAMAMFAALPLRSSAQSIGADRYDGATIVTQQVGAVPLIGTQVFVPAGLDRQLPQQNGLAALVAEAILQTPVGTPATPLHDAIAARGGSIAYTVDGHAVRFYIAGLAKNYGSQVLPLFRGALAAPDFSAPVLVSARKELERKIGDDQRAALTVGVEMLNRSFYANSDAGLPQYGVPAVIVGLTSDDAKAFYAAHYRRNGAVISAAGAWDAAMPAPDFKNVVDALAPGDSAVVTVKTPQLNGTSRQLVTHRDVSVPWLVAQYTAPPITSADFGPMLVLTTFLGSALAESAEPPTVATQPVSQRGIGAIYNFDAQPANVIVYVDGGLGDPVHTFATALTVVGVLGHAKLEGGVTDMQNAARGQFVNGTTTLEDRAWLAGTFAMQSGSPDYLTRVLTAISKTTAPDLQRVANKYFGNPTIALVLPRAETIQTN